MIRNCYKQQQMSHNDHLLDCQEVRANYIMKPETLHARLHTVLPLMSRLHVK